MGSRFVATIAALAATLVGSPLAFGAAGDLDTTFANAGRVAIAGASFGGDLALQADGKTVATQYVGFKVVRFNTDGSLDATFGTGGRSDSAASGQSSALAIQPDGYIVVGGFVDTISNSGDIVVARLDSAGHVDATFGAGGSVVTTITATFDSINAIALQADGKIVVGGLANQPASPAFFLARYDSGGTLDPSFGSGGIVTTDYTPGFDGIEDVAIQPDGAILAVGLTQTGLEVDMVLVRYESDGDLDPTFGTAGVAEPAFPSTTSEGFGVALQADGKILIGATASFRVALARFDDTGALDATFGDGGSRSYAGMGSAAYAYDLAVQPNGSIVLGGPNGSAGERDFVVARVLPNGDVDPTFGGGNAVALDINGGDNYATSVVLQVDGKVVAAGTAEVAPGDSRLALARFLGTGPCDPGPAPDSDADFVCDAGDPCANVSGARDFTADPAASVQIKYVLGEVGEDKLKLRATFDLPAGGFAAFDPVSDGARVLIRRSDTTRVIDAVLPAGAYAGKGTAGWVTNGSGNLWKFIDGTGSPVEGITRMKVRDQSRKSPDRVAVNILGKHGTYQVFPSAYPIRTTIVLGDAAASAAGVCGEGSVAE